ncbi:MAG TPA: HEAT repeat domain-containing protein [Candidatus Acidoferrales bacterium]|jgi:HEAT repeat protein|nr:HEAT repeat domain-containing protein [Candidatus Acidoferrales bacterium]
MKKSWLAIGLIAALSVLIVIALVRFTGGPPEPEYHGRKLSAWMQDLDSPYPPMQTNALFAIKQIGTNAVPYLIVQMHHPKDSPFKRKCMELLKRQHWVNIHFHYDFVAHMEAFQTLAILGPDGKAAIPDLANLLSNPEIAGDQAEAVYALSHIGPSSLPILENALTSSNQGARMDAANGLRILGAPSSVPNLLAALKNPDPYTRGEVVTALQRFPGQANVIVPALTNYIDDTDELFQVRIAQTLGSFGPAALPAFPNLLRMVPGTDYDVGMEAARALMNIDAGAALAAFTNNLESPDVSVRRGAARALMLFESQGEPAVPFLVNCVKDPDAKVRDSAADALWRIGADADLVVPALVENLNDASWMVRQTTAEALGSFGDRAKSAVPQILKLIQDNKGDRPWSGQLYVALWHIDPQAAAKLTRH